MKIKPWTAALLAMCFIGEPASADSFDDAAAAYANGDYDTAFKFYREAAARPIPSAHYIMGVMYWEGHGVEKDTREAIRWFKKAADGGNGDAQLELAIRYAMGEGVPQDTVIAHMWFNLAATSKYPEIADKGKQGRSMEAAKMTQEQIAEAQRMAREWVAAHPQN